MNPQRSDCSGKISSVVEKGVGRSGKSADPKIRL